MTQRPGEQSVRGLYATFHPLFGSVPSPTLTAGACPVCFGVKGHTYPRCIGCQHANISSHVGSGSDAQFVPLTTAFESGLQPQAEWYSALREYKRTEAGFDEHHLKLSTILGMGLHNHRARLEAQVGGAIDLITVVASSREHLRAAGALQTHELYRALQRLDFLAGALRPVLVHQGDKLRGAIDGDAFACIEPAAVNGKRIVLIDDTWVSGAGPVSARASLLAAGAAAVTIVVAARVVRPSFADVIGAADYLAHAGRLHDPERWPRDF